MFLKCISLLYNILKTLDQYWTVIEALTFKKTLPMFEISNP